MEVYKYGMVMKMLEEKKHRDNLEKNTMICYEILHVLKSW